MIRYRLIDMLRGTHMVTCYEELQRNGYSSKTLKSLQLTKLASFLVQLKESNKLYGSLLQSVDKEQIVRYPRAVLSNLPVIDKLYITEHKKILFCPVAGRRFQEKKTGGSTGEPFSYYVDLKAISEFLAFMLWCWKQYAEYQPGEPYLTVGGISLGSGGYRFKSAVYRFLQNTTTIRGDVIAPNMKIGTARMRRSRLLYGYPSSIAMLLDVTPSVFSKHSLRAVFTTSEQLTPGTRGFIEERLQVPVFDTYGANDGGVISCECEEHHGFHYNPLNCYIEEYTNAHGNTELLLTSLNSLSFPFVRYRVGDVARLRGFGSCPCGNPYPMIQKLEGRTRDIIRMPDGRAIHGSMINKILYDFLEVRRYRIVQTPDYRITLRLDIDDFDAWKLSARREQLEHEFVSLFGDKCFAIKSLQYTLGNTDKFKLIESHVS